MRSKPRKGGGGGGGGGGGHQPEAAMVSFWRSLDPKTRNAFLCVSKEVVMMSMKAAEEQGSALHASETPTPVSIEGDDSTTTDSLMPAGLSRRGNQAHVFCSCRLLLDEALEHLDSEAALVDEAFCGK